MPKLSLRFAAAVLFAMLPGPIVAAQQQPAAPTLTVTTRLVVLDVVVTDKKGNLITRPLTQDDFTVYDGGEKQTIRHFEAPEQHAMPTLAAGQAVVHSAADLVKIGDAPVTILVIDELDGTFQDMSYARQMLVKYLESQPAVLPNPAVLMVASDTTFQQIHDYTQDRDELVRAVKKHLPDVPTKAAVRNGPVAVERLAQGINALEEIAASSNGTPGRKNLIWVGNGYPAVNFPGMPEDEVATIEKAIRQMTARLLAARVTVYTINPTLATTSTPDIQDDEAIGAVDDGTYSPFGSGSVSFAQLAPSTGGLAFTGRNDLNNLIGKGIDQGRNYYTLAYTPTGAVDPAQYRKIRVVMKDPGLRAVTREGYFPPTAADTNAAMDKTLDAKHLRANLALDLSNALTTTIVYNGLAVTAEKTGADEYTLRVAEKGIGWSEPAADGAMSTEATVAAGWYDSKGKLIGHTTKELTCMRGSGGATYKLTVALPASAVRVRFVVRDARNGHMGTFDLKR